MAAHSLVVERLVKKAHDIARSGGVIDPEAEAVRHGIALAWSASSSAHIERLGSLCRPPIKLTPELMVEFLKRIGAAALIAQKRAEFSVSRMQPTR